MAQNGDGRWQINWYPVQCNVTNTPFYYSFQGSNTWYLKMQVSNTRCAFGAASSLSAARISMIRKVHANCSRVTSIFFCSSNTLRSGKSDQVLYLS